MPQNIRQSRGLRPVHTYNEGTPNEGSPTLVGFEDARPGWVRFLAGLGGVQGPDVSGMNAQLALAREGTTAQREMQTEKLRAELEQMREGAKHNLALEEIRNKYRLGQIGAEQAAALMNNLATNYAQHKGRMAELTAGGEQNRMTQAEGSRQKVAEQLAAEYKLDPNNPQQRAALDELINARMATKVANAKSDEGKQALTFGERSRDIGDYFDKVAKSRVMVNQNDAVFQPEIEALGVSPNMYRGQSTEEGIGPGGFPIKRTIPPSSTAIPSRRSMMTAPAGAPQQESVMLNPKWLQPSAPQPKASTAVAEPRSAEPYPTIEESGLVGVGTEALKRSGNVGFNFDNPLNPFAPNAPVNPINMLSAIIPGTDVNRAAAESLYKLLYGQKAQSSGSTALPKLIQLR